MTGQVPTHRELTLGRDKKNKKTISDTDTGPEENVGRGMGLVGAFYRQGGQGRP